MSTDYTKLGEHYVEGREELLQVPADDGGKKSPGPSDTSWLKLKKEERDEEDI